MPLKLIYYQWLFYRLCEWLWIWLILWTIILCDLAWLCWSFTKPFRLWCSLAGLKQSLSLGLRAWCWSFGCWPCRLWSLDSCCFWSLSKKFGWSWLSCGRRWLWCWVCQRFLSPGCASWGRWFFIWGSRLRRTPCIFLSASGHLGKARGTVFDGLQGNISLWGVGHQISFMQKRLMLPLHLHSDDILPLQRLKYILRTI